MPEIFSVCVFLRLFVCLSVFVKEVIYSSRRISREQVHCHTHTHTHTRHLSCN